MNILPLQWSEPLPPTQTGPAEDRSRYNSIRAVTPFGRFVITWKGWKTSPQYTVDETPWGEGIYDDLFDLQSAKQVCEDEWQARLKQCVSS